MNKVATVAGIVILVLVFAVGAYFFLSKNSSLMSQNRKVAVEQKSLSDFLSMAGSQKCTFSDSSNNSNGTIYVSSGKMSGNFNTTTGGKTATTHMVEDGTYFYIWTGGDDKGYKVSVDAMKAASESSAKQVQDQRGNSVDINKKANYSCSNWSPDQSVFTVPATVKFTDYTQLMQQMMNATGATTGATKSTASPTGTTQSNSAMCGQCDQLSGEAKTACRSALKCK